MENKTYICSRFTNNNLIFKDYERKSSFIICLFGNMFPARANVYRSARANCFTAFSSWGKSIKRNY